MKQNAIDLIDECKMLLDVLAESMMTHELGSRYFLVVMIKERLETVISRIRDSG